MKVGQAEVLEVYAWSLLVVVFGDVPYSEALLVDDGEYLPKYDDAATIYDDLLSRLDSAISSMQSGGMGFGSADLIYGNSSSNWLKFAYSLKVKLGMRLSDVSPAKSKAAVESAASGVFNSEKTNKDQDKKNKKFKYVKEIISGNSACLEFETEMNGIYVNGIDLITWDQDNKIIEFKVIVRPLQAVNTLHAMMGKMLDKLKSE